MVECAAVLPAGRDLSLIEGIGGSFVDDFVDKAERAKGRGVEVVGNEVEDFWGDVFKSVFGLQIVLAQIHAILNKKSKHTLKSSFLNFSSSFLRTSRNSGKFSLCPPGRYGPPVRAILSSWGSSW